MAVAENIDLEKYCTDVATRARRASVALATVGGDAKNRWLRRSAALIRQSVKRLAEANDQDIAAAPGYGLSDAAIDRLRLTPARIEEMAVGLEEIAQLARADRQLIDSTARPNGLRIDKVRVPLGVVFFIYESRPNVTADAAAICVKAGNAVILRGGKEAIHSNQAIAELLAEAAARMRAAGRCRATGEHDRPGGRGQVSRHAPVHRPGDSPRRREPDSPRGGRGAHARHQAFQRHLPRLRRSRRPTWTWPARS